MPTYDEETHENGAREITEILLSILSRKYSSGITIDERTQVLDGLAMAAALIIQPIPDYMQDSFTSIFIQHFVEFSYSDNDEFVGYKPSADMFED